MKLKGQKKIYSAGQTLIETLAAVFILAMGITAAVGLAIYAYNTSGGVVKQIIATGLAREGLEAVRNMRDLNWLQDTLVTNGCYDFVSGLEEASCYKNWLGTSSSGGSSLPYCINPSSGTSGCDGAVATANYSLGYNAFSSASTLWSLQRQTTPNYGMTFDPSNSTNGFYTSNGATSCANGAGMSDYCRKIVITKISNQAPYNQDDGPLLEVQSQVWWVDRNCPRASDFSGAPVTCRVELDTYLTNWKNF